MTHWQSITIALLCYVIVCLGSYIIGRMDERKKFIQIIETIQKEKPLI
jgi:hypothetical protein